MTISVTGRSGIAKYAISRGLSAGPSCLDTTEITDPLPEHAGSADLDLSDAIWEESCGKDEALASIAEAEALMASGKRPFSAPRVPRWVARLAELTELHRRRRARDHDDEARALVDEGRQEGLVDKAAHERGRWHRSRAKGQRERFERVDSCELEEEFVEVSCQACGNAIEKHRTCRVGLVCVHCRGLIASDKRGAFIASRREVLRLADEQGLRHPSRPGGRWSEKLLTLTIPHAELSDEQLDYDFVQDRIDARIIGWRIRFVLTAWRFFTIRLNKHLRGKKIQPFGWESPGGILMIPANEHQQGGPRRAVWWRSFEWTPARDRHGHPHIHVWFFGPYLDQDKVLDWWREALRSVGRKHLSERRPPKRKPNETSEEKRKRRAAIRRAARRPHEELWAIDESLLEKMIPPDIREVRDGERAAHEVIKYMTKDIVGGGAPGGQKIAPELYAPVYCELDGRRTTQSARGFIGIGKDGCGKACICGATGTFVARKVRPDELPHGRRDRDGPMLEAFGVTRPRAGPEPPTEAFVEELKAILDGGS